MCWCRIFADNGTIKVWKIDNKYNETALDFADRYFYASSYCLVNEKINVLFIFIDKDSVVV